MTNISSLKKGSQDYLNRINAKLEEQNTQSKKKDFKKADDRFWKPELDKAGNGYAVIRFLPSPDLDADGEPSLPWIKYFDHGFQGPTGKWYIENSLTTLDQKDPVSEYNSVLWKTGGQAGQDQARKQKRRLHYTSNILIVEDPKNPANAGTVRLYKYGKKIFDKLTEAMNPPAEENRERINPFNPFDGANFKLRVRNVASYPNYDKSDFDAVSSMGTEPKVEKILQQTFSLAALIAQDQFKSYDELKRKFDEVMGFNGSFVASGGGGRPTTVLPLSQPQMTAAVVPPVVAKAAAAPIEEEEDDLELDRFAQLADED